MLRFNLFLQWPFLQISVSSKTRAKDQAQPLLAGTTCWVGPLVTMQTLTIGSLMNCLFAFDEVRS